MKQSFKDFWVEVQKERVSRIRATHKRSKKQSAVNPVVSTPPVVSKHRPSGSRGDAPSSSTYTVNG